MEGLQAVIMIMEKESQNKYVDGKTPKNIRNQAVLSRDLRLCFHVIVIIAD